MTSLHHHSTGELLDHNAPNDNGGRGIKFSAVDPLGGSIGMAKKRNFSAPGASGLAKKQWKTAVLKIKNLTDPWKGYHLDDIPEENVTRYMYNPRSGKWKTDEIIIKMQSQSFAHGAMRECYRMKKLSKFSTHPNWRHASNYVAKRYMKEVGRPVYFQDVKLQMDAKLWGEEYNKHSPPKKVDFFQTYIIEFKKRDGSPLYCVEHLIEGDYIKYNSNSGFVSEMNRLTPHAFSHFTFEKSQHQLIIVDIQGVGDLYTDPQMHTIDQREYGEADLGTKGMALFFSSHICNPICLAMGLTQFDLSSHELDKLQNRKWQLSSSATKINLSYSEPVLGTRVPRLQVEGCRQTKGGGEGREEAGGRGEKRGRGEGEEGEGGEEGCGNTTTVKEAFRRLSIEMIGTHPQGLIRTGSLGYQPIGSPLESPGITMTMQHFMSVSEDGREEGEEEEMGDDDVIADVSFDMDSESGSIGRSEDSASFCSSVQAKLKQSKENGEEKIQTKEDSLKILGKIHLELALYHELGRLSQDQVPDLVSAQFHLETAAACTLTSALYTLAHIYLQQPHDSFENITIEDSAVSREKGMQYLREAAEGGHRAAMIELAKTLDTGGEGEDKRDWLKAAEWYNKALETQADASDANDTSYQATELVNPDYIITARLAEMYRSGGHQLERDPNKAGELYTQAAEVAMESMKGKLANKYYILAEEAWGEVEDD